MASYNQVSANTLIDMESGICQKNASWKTNIKYCINNDDVTITGLFDIFCSMDTEFGVFCSCHPLLEYWKNDNKIMTMLLNRDGDTFKLSLFNNDIYESIKIRPFDWLNGYIHHTIERGQYDKEKGGYPYRKFAAIIQKSEVENDKLMALAFTEEYNKRVAFSQNCYNKMGKEDNKELVIQMGTLMKEIDPDMYAKIDSVRQLLVKGNTSLLDCFISASLGRYADEEVEALLGTKIMPIVYAGETKTLSQLYFGIDEPLRIANNR